MNVMLRRFGLGLYNEEKLEEERLLGELPESATYELSIGNGLHVYASKGMLRLVYYGRVVVIDTEKDVVLLDRGAFVIPAFSSTRIRDLREGSKD
jgi:hypothetical protein